MSHLQPAWPLADECKNQQNSFTLPPAMYVCGSNRHSLESFRPEAPDRLAMPDWPETMEMPTPLYSMNHTLPVNNTTKWVRALETSSKPISLTTYDIHQAHTVNDNVQPILLLQKNQTKPDHAGLLRAIHPVGAPRASGEGNPQPAREPFAEGYRTQMV